MSKFRREFKMLYLLQCFFPFYYKTGSYGMYTEQIRHYYFCIPLIIGFRYTVSWGSNFN